MWRRPGLKLHPRATQMSLAYISQLPVNLKTREQDSVYHLCHLEAVVVCYISSS